MEITAAKPELMLIGQKLWQRGLVAGSDGNISCRVNEGILITASGISKGLITEADILLLNQQGEVLSAAPGAQKSTESAMHVAIYQAYPQVNGIVHAHPPYATAFALLEQPLWDIPLEEMRLALGQVPLLPYAKAGSHQLANLVAKGLGSAKAALLARHGALTVAGSLRQAWLNMEMLEQCCHSYYLAQQLSDSKQK